VLCYHMGLHGTQPLRPSASRDLPTGSCLHYHDTACAQKWRSQFILISFTKRSLFFHSPS
jgi:hypothetical protein